MLVDKNISFLESYHKRNYGFAIRLKFYSVKALSYLFASGWQMYMDLLQKVSKSDIEYIFSISVFTQHYELIV